MAASLADHRPPKRNGAGQPLRVLTPHAAPPGGPPAPPPAPDLPLRLVPRPEGLLQIHTAHYRGSFAAVYSQALRSAGLGSRVLVSQFLKGGVHQGVAGSLWLCGRLQWLRPATPLCLEGPGPLALEAPADEAEAASTPRMEAWQAVREVWDYSREALLAGEVDLLVLDELGLAVELGWLDGEEVCRTLEQRPLHLDVILTGPAMPPALLAMADQLTELRRGL
ncbi:MAG: cob(I)yrinic acid a,c-diamide adenosyltransferase [Cyanobium sp.]